MTGTVPAPRAPAGTKGTASGPVVTLILLVAAGAGCGGGGHDVPAHPTWVDDVRPIVEASCVSCHNATSEEPSFDYPTLADFMAARGNFEFLTSMGAGAVRRPALSSPMPPPPASPLPDWQVETLTRWCADPL